MGGAVAAAVECRPVDDILMVPVGEAADTAEVPSAISCFNLSATGRPSILLRPGSLTISSAQTI
jgi:hypothetical protein